MLRGISAKQFTEWQAFDELEPFGELRDDYRTASIVSTLVNLHRNVSRHPNPFPLIDFLLKWGDDLANQKPVAAPKKSWQELKFMGQWLAALYNQAEDADKKKRKRRG